MSLPFISVYRHLPTPAAQLLFAAGVFPSSRYIFCIMSFAGNIFAVAMAAWLLAVAAVAETPAVPDNPYAPIAVRNIFGLVPPPTNNPEDNQPPPEPPPKITPTGIMQIFGHYQAIFKVAVKPLPGQPQKDASYVMSVGEREDDIEVVKIDDQAGVVTFNNHGTVQELPLVAAPAATGGGAAPGGPPGGPPQMLDRRGSPGFMGGRHFSRGQPVVGAGNNNPGMPVSSPNMPTAGSFPGFGGPPVPNNPAGTEPITPEAQVIMMEAQRAKWQSEGNPAASIIPPTPLTHLLNGDNNGGPPAP